jgi:hypothetical protein
LLAKNVEETVEEKEKVKVVWIMKTVTKENRRGRDRVLTQTYILEGTMNNPFWAFWKGAQQREFSNAVERTCRAFSQSQSKNISPIRGHCRDLESVATLLRTASIQWHGKHASQSGGLSSLLMSNGEDLGTSTRTEGSNAANTKALV